MGADELRTNLIGRSVRRERRLYEESLAQLGDLVRRELREPPAKPIGRYQSCLPSRLAVYEDGKSQLSRRLPIGKGGIVLAQGYVVPT